MATEQSILENQRKLFDTARLLMKAGKIDDAITLYDYLLIQNPLKPQYWIAGGMAKMKRGYMEEAFASFQIAEAADETNPIPIMMRGLCMLKMKDEVGGLIALKRALLVAKKTDDWGWVTQSIERYIKTILERNRKGE